MQNTRASIEAGIRQFREKYHLKWDEITIVTAGDVLTSLSGQKVLYSSFRPDYAVFEPADDVEAKSIADAFGAEGAKVVHDKRFGAKVWLYVFSGKIPIPTGPFSPLPEVPGWKPPFGDHKPLLSEAVPGGEMTPFRFRDVLYRLENNSRLTDDAGKIVSGCVIRRESDDQVIAAHPMDGHYFITAFVWNDRCYCYGQNIKDRHRLDMTVSDDFIHWENPHCILDLTQENACVFNNGVTWDGKRFVMLYETSDPKYPIFTFKFMESTDLIHWKPIPGALYGQEKYVGGPALYYSPEDGYYYVTYVDQYVHPIERRLNYRTLLTRSRDLIHFEDAPEGRSVVEPVYSYRAHPEKHPDVYEFNSSDAEFIEDNGKVRVYFLGGNQLGVSDNQYAECPGTLASVFQSFYR